MSESKYKTTVGLEIHAELNTCTKMFCNSKNDPDEEMPNVNICSICLGHPGTLPTINKKAVEHLITVGLAVGGEIADFTEFDRKNYFYPDIPKGYQISQYKYPIVSGGKLNGIELTRIHLEEDTGLSKHDRGDYSLIDYNRAGIPLLELVTEPVIHSAKEAGDFAREFQLLLRYLGVAEANMEKGEMRVEANISISNSSDSLGTKVEVKNLNSFRSVERAIEFEVERMIELLEEGRGDEIVQETRGWDENKNETFSQRKKESSDDYRYFPEPDLPKMKLHESFDLKELEESLPVLPWEKRAWYKSLGLLEKDSEFLVRDQVLGQFFDEVVKNNNDKDFQKLVANYITSDLASLLKDGGKLPSENNFVNLINMIKENKVSSRGAKDILAIMVNKDDDPGNIANREGLLQESDEGALKEIVSEILKNNQKAVDEYKAGKEASLQFLIGQGMRETKGSANPEVLKKLLKDKLSS